MQPAFELVFGVQLLASYGDMEKTLQSFSQSTVCGLGPALCGLVLNLLFDRDLPQAIFTDPHLNQVHFQEFYPLLYCVHRVDIAIQSFILLKIRNLPR